MPTKYTMQGVMLYATYIYIVRFVFLFAHVLLVGSVVFCFTHQLLASRLCPSSASRMHGFRFETRRAEVHILQLLFLVRCPPD